MADSKTYTVEAILKATDSSFTKTMRGATAAVTALKGGSKGMSGLFKGGISSALSFGSVMGIASSLAQKGMQAVSNSVGGAIDRFDTLNKYPVVMKALGYSAQDVAKSTKLLSDGIDGLPTTLSDITKSAQNFAPLTGNATKAAKAAVALNNAFLASGASVGDTSRGMQQYTQMLSTGKVDMMSWRTLMETMPVALNKVAASFGYTGKSAKTDLFEALKNGEITIDQLNDKFIKLNKGQNGFAELAKKNSEGIGTSFANLKNAVVKNMANMLTAVDKGFGEAGLGSIAKTIDGLKGVINSTFESISPIVTNVSKAVIQAVKDMWESFKDTGAVTAVTNAFAHVKDAFEHVKESLSGNGDLFKDLGKAVGDVVTWLSQATTGISNFISNMKPGTIEATAKAIAGVVLAFKGLSLLANLNPFTIIVGAIAGLVLAFAQAYNSSEKFRTGVEKALNILKEWGPAIAAVVGGFAIFKMLNGWNPFKSFASKGKSAFDGLKTAMKGGSDGAKQSKGIIEQVFSGLGSVIESAGTAISTAAKGIGTGIKTALSGVPAIITSLGTAISTVATGIGTGLATAFQGLGAAIAIVPPTTWLALGAAILMVGAAFALAGTQANGISQIFQTVGNVIVQILQQVTTSLATLIPIVAGAMAMLVPIVANAIATIVGAVASGISRIILAFATGFSMVVSAVAGAIATVVGAFSGLISAIAQVITSIGTALQGLSLVFTSIFDGIANVITAFGDSVSGILDSIGGVFESFGESVKSVFEGASTVIESFGSTVKSILDGVSGVIDSIGNAALNAGKGVKQMAQGIKMLVDLPLGDLGATLAKTASGLGKIGNNSAGLAAAGSAMQQVSNGIRMIGSASLAAVSSMSQLSTRIQMLQTTMTSLPGVMMSAASSFSSFTTTAVAGMAGLVAINAPIAAFKLQLTSLSTAVTQASMNFTRLSTGVMVIIPAFTMMTSIITMFMTNLTMLSTTIMTISSSFTALVGVITSMTGAIMMVASSFSNVGAQATNAGNRIRLFAATSQVVVSSFSSMAGSVRSNMRAISSAISSGMSRAKSEVQSSMNVMLSTMQKTGNQMVSSMKSSGSKAGQGLASGLKGQQGSVTNAVASMINAAVNRARAGYGPMQSAGNWIGQGLANGMRSALGAVTAAANALVAQAERAAQAKARIASPSKLFRDEVGYWIGAGVAVGIDKSANLAVDSIASMYDDIQSVGYKASDLLDTNFSYNMSGGYNGTLQIENPSQNNLILGLLDQLNRSLDRDIVVSVNDAEIARATGDAINNYNLKKESALKRMRGEV